MPKPLRTTVVNVACAVLLAAALVSVFLHPADAKIMKSCKDIRYSYSYRNYSKLQLPSTMLIYQCCGPKIGYDLQFNQNRTSLVYMSDLDTETDYTYQPYGYGHSDVQVQINHCFPRTRIGFILPLTKDDFALTQEMKSPPEKINLKHEEIPFAFPGWKKEFNVTADTITFVKGQNKTEQREAKLIFVRQLVQEDKNKPKNNIYEDVVLLYFYDDPVSEIGEPMCIWQFTTGYEGGYKAPKDCEEGRLQYSFFVLALLMVIASLL